MHYHSEDADDADSVASVIERIINEGAIGMSAAARLMGVYRGGRPTHPSTMTRWAIQGVRSPNGSRIKLEVMRVGGRMMTSRAALIRFISSQTETSIKDPKAPTRSPTARGTAAESAAEALRQLGV